MKRLLSGMGKLVAFLALAVLMVTLSITIKGMRGDTTRITQVFQSPIETPTRPHKPTPMTPPATIHPKPSPPIGTATLPPPSPSQTLTPSTIPTRRATVTPPVSSTPITMPTVQGPLPPGSKVVYGEVDGAKGNTVIWLVSVQNPKLRKMLTAITHRAGYGIQGAVSPNENKIAYLVIPPDVNEKEARTMGGQLWVMNSDGTDARMIADRAGYLAMWTPDSDALVFGRLVALESPRSPEIPFRTELYLAQTSGRDLRLLLADETAYGLQPLGWSADGLLFYYARITLNGQWELWGVNRLSGATQILTPFPNDYLIQSATLSPDGTRVLLKTLKERQYGLIVLGVNGQEQKTVLSGATGDQPIHQYAATWSPDAMSILVHIPPQSGQVAHLEQIDLQTGQRHTVPTTPISDDEFFIPRSWSPDGEWLVVLEFPHAQSQAYLMRAAGGAMAQIPLAQSSNWVTMLGWIDSRK